MYNILTSHDANGIYKGVKTNGSEQYSKDFCSIHNERNSKKRQPSMKTVYKYAKLHDDGNDSCRREVTTATKLSKPPSHLIHKQDVCARPNVEDKNVKSENKVKTSLENRRFNSPVRRASKNSTSENNDRRNLFKKNNSSESIKLDDIEKEFDKISLRSRVMQRKQTYKRPSSFGKNSIPSHDSKMVQKPDRKLTNLPKKNICPSQTQPKVNSFFFRKAAQNTNTLDSKREPCMEQRNPSNKSRTCNNIDINKQDNVEILTKEQLNQNCCDMNIKSPTRSIFPKKIEPKPNLREEASINIKPKNSQDVSVNKFPDHKGSKTLDSELKELTVKSELGLNSNHSSLISNSPKKLNNCKSVDDDNVQRAISSPEATDHLKWPLPNSTSIIGNLSGVNKDECTEKPNQALVKNNSEERDDDDEASLISSNSLPHLKVPDMTIFERQKRSHLNKAQNESEYTIDKSEAVYISKTYVSFTQEKQINIKVVDSKQSTEEQNSGLIGSMGPYPFSVMSVIQREMRTSHSKSCCNTENENVINQESFYNSRIQNVFKSGNMNVDLAAYSKALIKPSDIIKEIKNTKKNCLDVTTLSTQFTRELNFLDSFIESIQYLKNTEKNDTILAEIKNKHSLFTHSVPTLPQAIDSEPKYSKSCDLNNMTIAETDFDITKSICLLNLLIRDEHRRAKKLLFVLKMREDALKDFTKSQILWLQSKKKMLDTDVSILKKKQRGALLKLHQECGEMDRMRKILMSISERRQAALMQTKKNIELKLRAGCEVESLWKSRKKIKNNYQRSRNFSPMKCFEISGNSYLTEDSTDKDLLNYEKFSVTTHSNIFEDLPKIKEHSQVTKPKPEKSVQTGNSIIEIVQRNNALPPCKDHTIVDGGYLNILLHNLALPQMFSSGKEYEVNTDALRGVLNSVNMVQNSSARVINISENKPVVILSEKNGSKSTSPSTARSLVEEFDKLFENYPYEKVEIQEKTEKRSDDPVASTTDKDASDEKNKMAEENKISHSPSVIDANLQTSSLSGSINPAKQSDEEEYLEEKEIRSVLPIGDLVEAEVNTVESEFSKSDESIEIRIHNCYSFTPTTSSQSSSESSRDSGPVNMETHIQHLCQPLSTISEELRRKELAIELEIKALQQQTQLNYCIREIPNKPPPPYTPPTQDVSEVTPPQITTVTSSVQADFDYDLTKLARRISDMCDQLFKEKESGKSEPPKNITFDTYLYDLCKEKMAKLSKHSSDEPWEACNIVPQKPPPTKEEFKTRIIDEIYEMMNSNTDRDSFGYGQMNYYQHKRPVNHIDDILLSDWRKCENEWTSLENDEVDVKNQVVRSVLTSLIAESLTDYTMFAQQ